MEKQNMNAASPAAAAKKKREPFIHIVKRDAMPWYKSWAVRACAVLADAGETPYVLGEIVTAAENGEKVSLCEK